MSEITHYQEIAAMVEAIPGFMMVGQEEYLFNKVRSLPVNAIIVEIGSFHGRSTVAMGYACKGTNRKIFCIDTWNGNDVDFHERDYFHIWQDNIIKNGLQNYVVPLKAYPAELLERWHEVTSGLQIDFLFIDGSHQFGDVLKGFEYGYAQVKERGFVAFHDVIHTHPGPLRVWHDIASKLLEEHEYVASLACGRKPIRSIQVLPIHFFTIVLNGEPFIRHHIEVFKDLNIPWHWHIIEGVADFVADTSIHQLRGGVIADELHRNGLSNDGTSAYLDQLAQDYPEHVTLYRRPAGQFWEGKRQMVSAPLANIKGPCLLWQVDVDELWTTGQIHQTASLFQREPHRTAALFDCRFFVGPRLYTATKNAYGNYTGVEWLRVWRYKPGDKWLSHEPPRLCRRSITGEWYDIDEINPFTNAETAQNGLVFDHHAYTLEHQLRFKELYYGYQGAVDAWKRLQRASDFPVKLKDYFSWVDDKAVVEKVR